MNATETRQASAPAGQSNSFSWEAPLGVKDSGQGSSASRGSSGRDQQPVEQAAGKQVINGLMHGSSSATLLLTVNEQVSAGCPRDRHDENRCRMRIGVSNQNRSRFLTPFPIRVSLTSLGESFAFKSRRHIQRIRRWSISQRR